MTLEAVAKAHGVQVHVLRPDGTFISHGPVTGRPVHVVETKAPDGSVRYLATRETVHIGRRGVSYPGPTKMGTTAIHRGEFEVETIAGRHHVRIYTAVVNPADLRGAKPEFKDVQQDPESGALTIAKGGNAVLWAGAGRPLRALQWLEKYDLAEGRGKSVQPGGKVNQPVLRSYLVPLDTFNKITSAAIPETATVEDSVPPTYNVDTRGEANQFGIGGPQFDALIAHAEPGSLISYPANPAEPFDHQEQAGRIVSPAELQQRLGLDPDFRSDALGKDNDPWFSWATKNDGSLDAKFLNDAHRLHDLATRLREHHLTWEQSKQDPADRTSDALIEPDADTIPNPRPDALPPKDMSFEARVQRLNQFLNEVGPAADNVSKITTNVLSTGGPVLREHLAGTPTPDVNQVAFDQVLREQVVPQAAKKAVAGLDKAIKNVNPNAKDLAQLQALMDANKPTGKKAKTFATKVVELTVDRFKTEVAKHPDLALLDEDSRKDAAEALAGQMRAALNVQFGKLGELDGLAPAGKNNVFLSGERLKAFAEGVKDTLNDQPLPEMSPQIDKGRIAEVAEQKVLGQVVTDALNSFTGKDLAGTQPAELERVVREGVLPDLEAATRAALKSDPALALADQNFRDAMADAVAPAAKTRAEQNLAGFEFDPVDPGKVEALMAKVPGVATQAEIGALMSADSDRIGIDFNTRAHGKDFSPLPFPNSFHEWKQQRPAQLEAQQQTGELLSTKIGETRTPEAVVDPEAVAAVVKELTVRHPELDRKFDEVATKVQKVPYRAENDRSSYTFFEHAQMVLGQFMKLTANENADARLVSVDALAKAILFHDIEKVNAKNQFGDGKGRHDREPEHKLAVEMMDRYRGLWNNEQEFQIARAMVDSDPFGFYVRGKLTAGETFKFINDLTTEMDPEGRPDSAQKLFEEFHQYYQADFSSYTKHSRFVDRKGNVQTGPNHFNDKFDDSPDGITKTPDGRHFEYAANSDAAKRMATLADMFRDPDTIQANRARIENGISAPPAPPVELSFDFAPGAISLTAEQSAQVGALANDLVDTATRRAAQGYSAPKVEVSGPHAWSVKPVLTAQLGGLVDVEVVPGRLTGADVRVDWDLNRAETTSTPGQSRKVIDDESWRHSPESTADWSAPSESGVAGGVAGPS